MSSMLCPKRSNAAPARRRPRPATTSWPRLLSLKKATPAAFRRVESSRVSGCPEENTDPRPCTHTSAVRRRPRGSATTPSSQTPSRVAMRTSETATPTDLGITGHWPVRGNRSSANGDTGRERAGRSIISQVSERALGRGAFSGEEDAMLTHEENELITRISPGTPMGTTLRRYWIPALLASELPQPDCPPVRVKLLGEDLVAFRDTEGRIGLLEELCPHRRASLFFGRNEECGLRCVYHGWKFDVHGNCVDMPTEPRESTFKDKIKTKAYPTAEYGGCIWVYMGPPDKQPALPHLEWARVPDSQRVVSPWIQECNYMQAVEGEIDSAHVSWLHAPLQVDHSPFRGRFNDSIIRDGAPKLTVKPTDYGFCYGARRDVDRDE